MINNDIEIVEIRENTEILDTIPIEESNDNKIVTNINLLSISELSSDSKNVDCNFLFECIYNEQHEEHMNFMIENCLEVYSKEKICCSYINEYTKKTIWNYKAKIQVLNYTRHIPYNYVYLVINMVLNDYYCDNNIGIRFTFENNYNINNNLHHNIIDSNVIIPKNKSTISFIWSYKLYNYEHIGKYMLIPMFLTLLLQLTHRLKNENRVDYVSIMATLLLSDIALLFTIPETHSLIASEKVIYLNIILKLFVGTFAFYDGDIYVSDDLIPDLSHHGIDYIINIMTGLLTFCLMLYELYISRNVYKNIQQIFKYNEKNKGIITWDLQCFQQKNKIDS